MNKFINLCVIIVAMVMTFALTSCDKDAPVVPNPTPDPTNPGSAGNRTITLTINKPITGTGTVDGKDMKIHAYFMFGDSLVKKFDNIKLGDNKIDLPKMTYTNVVISTHDYKDFKRQNVTTTYPKILGRRGDARGYLPSFSMRHLMYAETLSYTNLTTTDKVSFTLKTVSRLVMVKKTIDVSEPPRRSTGSNSSSIPYRIVKDPQGQEWYALYYKTSNDTDHVAQFLIGQATPDGQVSTRNVNAHVLQGEVVQYTFYKTNVEPKVEKFSFDAYDHAKTMGSATNWYMY